MSTPNPMDGAYSNSPSNVSRKDYPIAGITVTVFGLDELPKEATEVACLWLLHPRLADKSSMDPIAFHTIREWNARSKKQGSGKPTKGLICASFDQRNHGDRLINARANEAWRNGNPKHAQDMFSVYQGTASDTSLLITYLPAYVFPNDEHEITSNMVLGVSLGGYACWHCILHDERITTAVIVVGCCDYVRVMSDRAAKSKLETWHSTSPPGANFLGSKDFPKALWEAVKRLDPAGLFLGKMDVDGNDNIREPSESEKKSLVPLMSNTLKGKRIFNLAGGADKLVPYKVSEPLITWLQKAIAPNGWFGDGDIYLKNKVYEGVGHAMSPQMKDDAVQFVIDTLSDETSSKTSKI